MEPKIIFENDDFFAIDKPSGLLVHNAQIAKRPSTSPRAGKLQSAKSESTLVDWILKNYPVVRFVGDNPETRPGIVHRLDRDTSGIMLIPKTQDYFEYLKKLFKEHKIKKTYLAIVLGVPKEREGTIAKPIGIKEGTVKRSVYSQKLAKDAITNYKILKTFEFPGSPSQVLPGKTWEGKSATSSLLEVTPQTGRTHQIRIHLSSIGYPILGDTLYGNKQSYALSQELHIDRQMLHAFSVEFEAEPGKKLRIEVEPPEEFTRTTKKL